MSSIGFTGSRSVNLATITAIQNIATSQAIAGHHIMVGCATGADKAVRTIAPTAQVFRAANRSKTALVGRSITMVKTLAAAGSSSQLFSFPGCPCPAGITPGKNWQTGRPTSGTWSTTALAAGLGIPVIVFFILPHALPNWPGHWQPTTIAGYTGHKFIPATKQLKLF